MAFNPTVVNALVAIAGVLIGVMSALMAWKDADSRSQERQAALRSKVEEIRIDMERSADASIARITNLEILFAESKSDRVSLHQELERKASKEAADGILREVAQLRTQMDQGFQRLEQVIRKV